MMTKEEYLGVSDEISILNNEQREWLYEVALLYDEYLLNNNMFDENDLIRELFANRDISFPSYDFAMVDETQDYTELQLYFVHQICTDPLNVVFAGDVHQIINPTVFDVSRLKSLYLNKDNHSALEIYFLRSNFRCQQGVVDLANKISNLRREAVGRKNEEIERPESSSVPVIYSYPYRLSYTNDNLKDMIEELIRYPNIAILVSSNAEKRKIKDFIISNQCVLSPDEMPQIFTVAEIKGMEYAYIVCFNMISSFDYLVSKIFKDSKVVKSRETRNRFCFNAMYVATTRAQHHLCFIDEYVNENLEKCLELPVVSIFEPSELYFDTLSDSLEAWRTKAIELKENGNYEEALRFLKRAGNSAQETDFYECKAELALRQRSYDIAVLYFLFLDDIKNVRKYVGERTVSKETKDYIKFVVEGKAVENITETTRRLALTVDTEDRELLFSKTLDNIESSLIQAYDSLVIPEV
jgi:superfamily I DNA/RNA helicase